MVIKCKLDDGAYLPEVAYFGWDAGYDLKTKESFTLKAHSSYFIDTGVHLEIPSGMYGQISGKSGLNKHHNIYCFNGIIDAGYSGSVGVNLYNFSDEDYEFVKGQKIAQIIFNYCAKPIIAEFPSIDKGPRGDTGYGSTGK